MGLAKEPRPSDWDMHRDLISELYWCRRKKLPEVQKIMRELHGFDANPKSYKRHFDAWCLKKNLTTEESMVMLAIMTQRRVEENKETEFIRHGNLVDNSKLLRFARRHKTDGPLPDWMGTNPDLYLELPPYIRYRTPNPTEPGEPSVAATSAPFQSEPDTPVGGQPPTGRSPESYGIQSPQNSDLSLSWEHQLAAMDSPDPAPANIGHYIGTSYSPEHPVSSVKASPTYCHSPWSYPTKPNLNTLATWDQTGHPEQTAWYPPSAFDPELAIQDSLAHDTSSTRSSMNYTTAETGPSYAASLVLDVQQDWLLHGADLDNNPSHASGLWGSGVDSNCTVEGGITPLHYVAYQRNAGMAGVPPREGGLSSWDHTSYRG